MIAQRLIEEVKKRLVRFYRPREIYIFDSYTWGTPKKESDLDVLIVLDSYKKKDLYFLLCAGQMELDLEFPIGLAICSMKEFDKFSKDRNRLCYTVKHHGQKIYESCA